MVLFYLGLVVMLLLAVGVLASAFLADWRESRAIFFMAAAFMIAVSISAYSISGNYLQLQQWLAIGKPHYQLQMIYDEMGGIDGMIARVKAKLAFNPHDAQGWLILSKLYKMKNDNKAAEAALQKSLQYAK